jgi:excisionase family DNA binding protein
MAEGTLLMGTEVAELTRVKLRTVHSWVQDGRLRVVKVGRLNRFLLRDVERFVGVAPGTLKAPTSTP